MTVTEIGLGIFRGDIVTKAKRLAFIGQQSRFPSHYEKISLISKSLQVFNYFGKQKTFESYDAV